MTKFPQSGFAADVTARLAALNAALPQETQPDTQAPSDDSPAQPDTQAPSDDTQAQPDTQQQDTQPAQDDSAQSDTQPEGDNQGQ